MAQNVNPTFVKTPNWGATQITTGTGANNYTTVYTGGANGSKINALIATGFTSNAFDVSFAVSSGGTAVVLGTVAVPASAGISSIVPSVNMVLNANLALDSDGNPFLFLPSSAYLLQVKTSATSSTWTSGNFIGVVAPSVGDF